MLAWVLLRNPGADSLLGGQAAADLVPPLEYAHAHAAVLDQVHGQQQGLGSPSNYYRIETLVCHHNPLNRVSLV